jgi:hypothetical protein
MHDYIYFTNLISAPKNARKRSHSKMGTFSLSELEQYLWDAANILRGPVDASDFKVQSNTLKSLEEYCNKYIFV